MKALHKSSVVVAIGSGGVGKTTVASALGIYFAKRGCKTLVITIDPARRLLDAMGVKENADEPRRVVLDDIVESSQKNGELYVLMPDLKKEWASFLEACVAQSDVRHKISSNHFYQFMADGMPGALEIISSHILYRLIASKRFDKIILDTPPSSNSIAFFDVPQKISRVLEQGVFRALMSKRNSMFAMFTKKLAFFSGGILQSTFERIIGSHFLSELIDFALSIDALYEPLLERVRAMDNLLKSENTKFALIVKPSTTSVDDSVMLKAALHERGIHIAQLIINQVMPFIDEKEIARELLALEQNAREKFQSLADIYVKENVVEKNLIKRLAREHAEQAPTMIFMNAANKSRTALLKKIVSDLEKGES